MFGKKVTYDVIKKYVENKTREKEESVRRYSESYVQTLRKELTEISAELTGYTETLSALDTQIQKEQEKLEALGVDPLLLEATAH